MSQYAPLLRQTALNWYETILLHGAPSGTTRSTYSVSHPTITSYVTRACAAGVNTSGDGTWVRTGPGVILPGGWRSSFPLDVCFISSLPVMQRHAYTA